MFSNQDIIRIAMELLLRMVKCPLCQECGKMWFFPCLGGDNGQTGNGCG